MPTIKQSTRSKSSIYSLVCAVVVLIFCVAFIQALGGVLSLDIGDFLIVILTCISLLGVFSAIWRLARPVTLEFRITGETVLIRDLSFLGLGLKEMEFDLRDVVEIYKDIDGGSKLIEKSGRKHSLSEDLMVNFDQISQMIRSVAPHIILNKY